MSPFVDVCKLRLKEDIRVCSKVPQLQGTEQRFEMEPSAGAFLPRVQEGPSCFKVGQGHCFLLTPGPELDCIFPC